MYDQNVCVGEDFSVAANTWLVDIPLYSEGSTYMHI